MFTFRHWKGAPRQNLLLLTILALGIAVHVAIRLANQAAVAGFQTFTEVVSAESDWVIRSRSGPLPESVLTSLRSRLGSRPVSLLPILETTAVLPRGDDDELLGARTTYQLLGLDLIALQNFASQTTQGSGWFDQKPTPSTPLPKSTRSTPSTNQAAWHELVPPDDVYSGRLNFWELFQDPRSVFISESLARRAGLNFGDTFPLVIYERIVDLRVAGIIPSLPDQPSAPVTLIVMDLPALQTWVDRRGQLDRVEVFLDPGPDRDERYAELETLLKDWLVDNGENPEISQALQLVTPQDRREAAAMMTRAFRLNLSILSMLALVVGLYLIFQALDGAVVRRRGEISILRALGVTEREIWVAWLMEALLLGVAGGVAGALLGWLGAQWTVRLVGQTVNALYHATHAESVALSLSEFIRAMVLSVAAGLMAGWIPARLAARTPPAQILGKTGETTQVGLAKIRNRAFWGGLLLGLGGLCLQIPPLRWEGGVRLPLGGYLAAILWVVGCGLVGGQFLRWTSQSLSFLGKKNPWLRLALSHLIRPSGRHRWALASLICAVSLTSGMAILVASFDQTMRGWIERTFQADLYLSSDGAQSASSQHRILKETWEKIVSREEILDFNIIQVADVVLDQGSTLLIGADLRFAGEYVEMAWIQEPRVQGIHDPELNSGWVWVSESFGDRFQKRRGDTVRVPTPTGWKELEIVGVFADYGNERGSMMVDRHHWRAWFGHDQATSLILKLKAESDPEMLRALLRGEHPGLTVFTNRHLRQEILRIFRQTFAITYALELIGLIVAVAGLGITLASILVDRRAEFTTLRAMGVRHGELARASAWEGGILSLTGAVLGLILSLALGWVLIYVINKQTFGWTLEFVVPTGLLTALALLLGICGVGVSLAVGRWGADLAADRED